ncbi:MAG: hypothetical protein A2161_20105 [Candidatus Schekmanbacteria bacterium RBG_13_48_7]|uniref:MurNAc-LAA domain-containing protein n=1 Tax=Candidatus Schekmanbacteria bacterium RBG_13_48_7 TaxID=1817878 RepID=A0A1F7S1U6_9BACT|nr:MAG: hypothetical protein A2161_20105 [Candidatus Schekmanbacteria bacterium RBG_13_48_7]
MKICIDAGHGGSDPGAVTYSPFYFEERDFNLNVALLLEKQLKIYGQSVIMTRRVNRSLALSSRTSFANKYKANFFVSIHANAAESESVEGMEIFHFPGSKTSQKSAKIILDNMHAEFPDHKIRGIKEANFAVLRLTDMPAVLVECEFLTNPVQLKFLNDSVNQHKLAFAIVNGIMEFIF